jgi:alkylation response protein AidB-like acyl-CoA dehydrogenase
MSHLQEEDRLLIQEAVDKFILDNYPFEEKEKRLAELGQYGGHWGTFAELGWLMLPFAEEAGGLGGGIADVQVLLQAFGRGLIAEPFSEVVLQAGKALEFCAPESSREQLLLPLMSGEQRVVLAHGEVSADADFSAVTCIAETCAEGYRLTGSKRVVCQAGSADRYIVTAKLNNEPALFLVDAGSDNLERYEYLTIDTRYASDLQLDGVTVPAAALVATGEVVAEGVRDALLYTFAGLAAEVHGIAKNLRLMTAEYLNTREQFGTKIANFQALQHLLADMVIAEEEIASLAWLMSNVWEMEDSTERERLIRSTKARMCVAGRQLAEIAVQLHGGVGVTDELIVSHYLRRMVAIDALYGDSQQQLLWLAQQV